MSRRITQEEFDAIPTKYYPEGISLEELQGRLSPPHQIETPEKQNTRKRKRKHTPSHTPKKNTSKRMHTPSPKKESSDHDDLYLLDKYDGGKKNSKSKKSRTRKSRSNKSKK